MHARWYNHCQSEVGCSREGGKEALCLSTLVCISVSRDEVPYQFLSIALAGSEAYNCWIPKAHWHFLLRNSQVLNSLQSSYTVSQLVESISIRITYFHQSVSSLSQTVLLRNWDYMAISIDLTSWCTYSLVHLRWCSSPDYLCFLLTGTVLCSRLHGLSSGKFMCNNDHD